MSGSMSAFLDGMRSQKMLNDDLGEFHHATGLDLVDMHNGVYDAGQEAPLCGLKRGRACMIVGKAGSGKTTLAIQMGMGITAGVPNAHVLHFDVEHGTSAERLEALSGETYEDGLDSRYTLIQREISSESFHSVVSKLHDHKIERIDEYTVPMRDFAGRETAEIAPTVVILDSLNMLSSSQSLDAEELDGNMAAAHRAKINAGILRKLNNRLFSANIHLIVVNHITTNINTGPTPQAAQTRFLTPDEYIPGGSVVMYMTDYLVRLRPRAKLEESDKFKIKGFLVQATAVKSRGNAAGKDYQLVLDQARGFDNDLSNFLALRETGAISSGGAYFWFKNDPKTRKFRQSEFKAKIAADEDLARLFKSEMDAHIRDWLPVVGTPKAKPPAESGGEGLDEAFENAGIA